MARRASDAAPSGAGVSRTKLRTPATDAGWHALGLIEVLAKVGSKPAGLSPAEVERRRSEVGANALPAPAVRSKAAIFITQFQSVPVAMLAISAVVSVATGGVADAVAIVVVMLANASIGYITESKAERVISSIGRTNVEHVEVVRAGVRQHVAPESIVPGDVLVLGAGTFVAADARLLDADGLVIDESALTGESVPVHKSAAAAVDLRAPLADRANMVYRGTLVTGGSGTAVVVAIGVSTQIGLVQNLVGSVLQRETPLQAQLRKLGVQLAVVAGSVCVGVFGVGLLRGYPLTRMLGTSISLAVAAIPEGLPTVAITTLALGIRDLARHRVLVRQLNAVETLGAVQVMCLDKTGTITINRMTAVAVHCGLRYSDVNGPSAASAPSDAAGGRDLEALLRVAVLCNEVEVDLRDGVHVLRGSPTEAALVQLAIDSGVDVQALRRERPVLATQYRSERRSFMATLHAPEPAANDAGADAAELVVAVKGRSPEVLAMCSHMLRDGVVCPLGDAERLNIETAAERMAGQALRVLGFAGVRRPRSAEAAQGFTLEGARDLVWFGLIGMSDPPRDGMRETLARFHDAGIRTVMITGDQSATAHAIGKSVGLNQNGPLEILDATELDAIAPDVLSSLVKRTHIFARVSPAHKLQIVRALQAAGHTVAMTGDGINDSPALKAADVGVAMGRSGTNAAREVADVILQDDDLSTMIGGIEGGRAIYDDIKKAVRFILATNLSEILLTATGIATGIGETLTPMQLLWINLMTDIAPELALAVQPAETEVLRRPPRDPARAMFEARDVKQILLQGGFLTAGPLFAYLYGRQRYGVGPHAGTLAFTVVAVAQLLHAISARSEQHTIFDSENLAPNRYIPIAIGGGILLQVAAPYIPGLRTLLGLVPLGLLDWGIVGLGAVGPLLANETTKWIVRGSGHGAAAPRLV
jgi:Ca2+-transporting ATPase